MKEYDSRDLMVLRPDQLYQDIRQKQLMLQLKDNKAVWSDVQLLIGKTFDLFNKVLTIVKEEDLIDDNRLCRKLNVVKEICSIVEPRQYNNLLDYINKNFQDDGDCIELLDLTLHIFFAKYGLLPDQKYMENQPAWVDYLIDILSNELGNVCSDKKEWHTLKAAKLIANKFEYEFQHTFTLDINSLKKIIIDLDTLNHKDILERNHLLTDICDVNSLIDKYKQSSEDDILKSLPRDIELAGYVALPAIFNFLKVQCFKQKDSEGNPLILALLNKLNYPILQYSFLFDFKTLPSSFLSLINVQDAKALSKTLVEMVFDLWFKSYERVMENLNLYLDYNRYRIIPQDSPIRKEAKQVYDATWKAISPDAHEFYSLAKRVLTRDEIVQMTSNIPDLSGMRDSTHKKIHQEIRDAWETIVVQERSSYFFFAHTTRIRSFDELILTAKSLIESDNANNGLDAEKLLKEIQDKVHSNEFIWDVSLSGKTNKDILTIAQLYTKVYPYKKDKILGDLKSIETRYEGWNIPSYAELADNNIAECYSLCVLLSTLNIRGYYPDSQDQMDVIKVFGEFIVSQMVYSASYELMSENYAKAPLLLLELFLKDIVPQAKDAIDKIIIGRIPSLTYLRYLTSLKEISLSDANKDDFKKRWDEEWQLEKLMLKNRKQKDIETVMEGLYKALIQKSN